VKIAFDENIPIVMVRVFETLAREKIIPEIEVFSAAAYRPVEERGDENWVKRFASAGGKVVISGDVQMRSRLHERAALAQAGVVTYFFEGPWSRFNPFSKSAMLIQWWPYLVEHMKTGAAGSCWEIPVSWNVKELKNVSTNPAQISKEKKPKPR
jgi:tryptophan synthase alpha subunit